MTERRKSRKLRRHNKRDEGGRKDIIQTESKIETQREREMDKDRKGKGQRKGHGQGQWGRWKGETSRRERK